MVLVRRGSTVGDIRQLVQVRLEQPDALGGLPTSPGGADSTKEASASEFDGIAGCLCSVEKWQGQCSAESNSGCGCETWDSLGLAWC